MRLEEVLPAYRAGKRIRRKSWAVGLHAGDGHGSCDVWFDADDWEVVPTPHKACPFCGGSGYDAGSHDSGCHWIVCESCRSSTGNKKTAEQAWELWDRRAP